MQDEFSTLCGQIESSLDWDELSRRFAESGLEARVGESSHYAGGRYLRIERGEAEISFERIEAAEHLVRGDASCQSEMNGLARAVSDVLSRWTHRHRFEVYCALKSPEITGYFHFDWPQGDP